PQEGRIVPYEVKNTTVFITAAQNSFLNWLTASEVVAAGVVVLIAFFWGNPWAPPGSRWEKAAIDYVWRRRSEESKSPYPRLFDLFPLQVECPADGGPRPLQGASRTQVRQG